MTFMDILVEPANAMRISGVSWEEGNFFYPQVIAQRENERAQDIHGAYWSGSPLWICDGPEQARETRGRYNVQGPLIDGLRIECVVEM